jgi:hypothetical protein
MALGHTPGSALFNLPPLQSSTLPILIYSPAKPYLAQKALQCPMPSSARFTPLYDQSNTSAALLERPEDSDFSAYGTCAHGLEVT